MKLFAIADTHLSLAGNKPMDCFPGWENYVDRLKTNWLSLVGEEDYVVIAGDISWAMSLEEAEADFAFLHSLPGRKIILKGNHDYWWTTMRKMTAFLEEKGFDSISIVHNNAYPVGSYAVCGSRGWFFDAEEDPENLVILREAMRLERSLQFAFEMGKKPLTFLHYPPLNNTLVCTEIFSVLEREKVENCWYGHLHGPALNTAFTGEKNGIKFGLISADYLKFCPLLIKKDVNDG